MRAPARAGAKGVEHLTFGRRQRFGDGKSRLHRIEFAREFVTSVRSAGRARSDPQDDGAATSDVEALARDLPRNAPLDQAGSAPPQTQPAPAGEPTPTRPGL